MIRKNLPILAIGLVLLTGICVLLYPVVSALIAKLTEKSIISGYQKTVNTMNTDEISEMEEDARQYNENLFKFKLSGDSNNQEEADPGSDGLLSVNKVIGYIKIPKINVYLPIYQGTSDETLKKGVGLLEDTSLPIGGNNTHAVLSGHRGLPSATLFTDLDQLAQGDIFFIYVLNEKLAYRVDQIKVVDPGYTDDLQIIENMDYVTLVTCTPYGINTQRLHIRGARIGYEAAVGLDRSTAQIEQADIISPIFFTILAVPIGTVILAKRKSGKRKCLG